MFSYQICRTKQCNNEHYIRFFKEKKKRKKWTEIKKIRNRRMVSQERISNPIHWHEREM